MLPLTTTSLLGPDTSLLDFWGALAIVTVSSTVIALMIAGRAVLLRDRCRISKLGLGVRLTGSALIALTYPIGLMLLGTVSPLRHSPAWAGNIEFVLVMLTAPFMIWQMWSLRQVVPAPEPPSLMPAPVVN